MMAYFKRKLVEYFCTIIRVNDIAVHLNLLPKTASVIPTADMLSLVSAQLEHGRPGAIAFGV